MTSPDAHKKESPFPDDLCRKCGRCCAQKIVVNGTVFATERFCPFFDPATRLCTVYEHRFQSNPRCLTVEAGIKASVFPSDCPYVQRLPGYVPPRPEIISERVMGLLEAGKVRDVEDLIRLARLYPPEESDQ